jgi:uncharacterized protein YkwD
LEPFIANVLLDRTAQAHSTYMASVQRMTHTGKDNSNVGDRAKLAGYNFYRLGENLAYGYEDLSTLMSAWMASGGHRKNILQSDFIDVGVGISNDINDVSYICIVFGQSRGF